MNFCLFYNTSLLFLIEGNTQDGGGSPIDVVTFKINASSGLFQFFVLLLENLMNVSAFFSVLVFIHSNCNQAFRLPFEFCTKQK